MTLSTSDIIRVLEEYHRPYLEGLKQRYSEDIREYAELTREWGDRIERALAEMQALRTKTEKLADYVLNKILGEQE